MVQRIELGGKYAVGEHRYALVDDADFARINAYRWHAKRSRRTFYARRMESRGGKGKQVQLLMHREILGLGRQDVGMADHIDHNGLNNIRSNLRIVDAKGNSQNITIDTVNYTCDVCGRAVIQRRKATGRQIIYCSAQCRGQASRFLNTQAGARLAARILSAVNGEMTAKQIAERSGLHIVSVWRLMPRLIKEGAIRHVAGGGRTSGEFVYQRI